MKTLKYWYIACEDDSDCYSIVAKTKKDALNQLDGFHDKSMYSDTVKLKEIPCKSMFDLFSYVTGEGGGKDAGETIKSYKINK